MTDRTKSVTCSILRAADFTSEHRNKWNRFRELHSDFQTPYYDLAFLNSVVAIRDDVEIAVIRRDESIIAFLPFQRVNARTAEPIGGRLNDYHGFLKHPSEVLDIRKILRDCQLDRFNFHSGIGQELEAYSFQKLVCPYVDLEGNVEQYFCEHRKRSSHLKKQAQKTRAIQRDVGSLNFEFDCRVEETLEQTIRFKSQKYRRTKIFDIFQVPWTVDLVREMFYRESGLRGILSTLKAGNEIVGAHIGMVDENILHYWFPIYDPKFGKYSPGTELITQVINGCGERGIDIIDFGYGDQEFKLRYSNKERESYLGCITSTEPMFQLSKQWHFAKATIKRAPFKHQLKTVLRAVYSNFGAHKFR